MFRDQMLKDCAIQFLACAIVFAAAVPRSLAKNEAPVSSPGEMVRRAVNHEIAANSGPGLHFMFADRKQTAHLSETKLIVETRDATAGMIIAQDGHPLTPQQQQAEKARLENYIHNPEELNRKRKQEKEDADHTSRILKALPDAFLYERDGAQDGSETVGRPGDELVKLKFRPNPNYVPPTRVEQVLTGMSGHLLIDPKENHIAEIDGTLQKDVGFGWGILGHLDRGGRFFVQQADVSDGHWEVTRMELSFTGKILLFKKLNIKSSDVFTSFRPVPDLSFAQGVELLKKEVAQNELGAGGAGRESGNAKPEPPPNKSKQQTKDAAQNNICCDR
jgi:hypothetical protein